MREHPVDGLQKAQSPGGAKEILFHAIAPAGLYHSKPVLSG
jgi:hypothetical protein